VPCENHLGKAGNWNLFHRSSNRHSLITQLHFISDLSFFTPVENITGDADMPSISEQETHTIFQIGCE